MDGRPRVKPTYPLMTMVRRIEAFHPVHLRMLIMLKHEAPKITEAVSGVMITIPSKFFD